MDAGAGGKVVLVGYLKSKAEINSKAIILLVFSFSKIEILKA